MKATVLEPAFPEQAQYSLARYSGKGAGVRGIFSRSQQKTLTLTPLTLPEVPGEGTRGYIARRDLVSEQFRARGPEDLSA